MLYLRRNRGWDADRLEQLVDRESGLLGVSGLSNDVRQLLKARAEKNAAATLALEMFAYEAAQAIARMAVALGGVEQLVFTGGIGEHAEELRAEICELLRFLGVQLDDEANESARPGLNQAGASVEIRIVPAQEERQIALLTASLCES
jgi:acetate kinase